MSETMQTDAMGCKTRIEILNFHQCIKKTCKTNILYNKTKKTYIDEKKNCISL